MTKKEIRQKYCDKRNYTSWTKYNITEYGKWLENELIKTQKKVKKLTLTDVVSCVCKIPEPRLKVSENGTYSYCNNCSKTYWQK
jgi:hypothetical protein